MLLQCHFRISIGRFCSVPPLPVFLPSLIVYYCCCCFFFLCVCVSFITLKCFHILLTKGEEKKKKEKHCFSQIFTFREFCYCFCLFFMKEKKTDLSQYLFSFRCKRCQTVHHSHSCRRFTVFFFGGGSAVTKTMTFSNVLGSMCVFYERDDASEPFLLLLLPCSD